MKLPTVLQVSANFTQVDFDNVVFWFSYGTLIAYHVMGNPKVIRQNDFSNTTGKHLNVIDDDHTKRVKGVVFEAMYQRDISLAAKGLFV
jgi:hypothetical protein